MTKTQLTNLSSLVELVVVTLFLLSRLPYNRTHLNTSLLSHTMDRVSFAQTLTRFLSNTAIIKGTTNPHPFSLSHTHTHTHPPLHTHTHPPLHTHTSVTRQLDYFFNVWPFTAKTIYPIGSTIFWPK